jgi:hypothetical protein
MCLPFISKYISHIPWVLNSYILENLYLYTILITNIFNNEGLDILLYLQVNKLDFHSFMEVGKIHNVPGLQFFHNNSSIQSVSFDATSLASNRTTWRYQQHTPCTEGEERSVWDP